MLAIVQVISKQNRIGKKLQTRDFVFSVAASV